MKSTRLAILAVALFGLPLVMRGDTTDPCPEFKACEVDRESTVVFIGVIREVKGNTAVLELRQWFKGDRQSEYIVESADGRGFNWGAKVGGTFLVRGILKGAKVKVSLCGMKPVGEATKDIAFYREVPRFGNGNVTVTVERTKRKWDSDGRMKPRQREPLVGAEMLATRFDETATKDSSLSDFIVARGWTNDAGLVRFESLPAGDYWLWSKQSNRSRIVYLCHEEELKTEFEFEEGKTIAGTVLDADGLVKSDATIGLLRAKDDGSPGESFVGAGLFNDKFEIDYLPPGKYFLKIDQDDVHRPLLVPVMMGEADVDVVLRLQRK